MKIYEKTNIIRYNELIEKYLNGELRIPQFQRPYVWNENMIIELMDTLMKGLSIGSFVFWDTKERVKSFRSIGNINTIDNPKGENISYIIDGQQRLTTILACVSGAKIVDKNGKIQDFSKIYINLEANINEKIVTSKIKTLKQNSYISITRLMNEKLSVIVEECGKKYEDKLEEYRGILWGRGFTVITLLDISYEKVIESFIKLNTNNIKLSHFTLVSAGLYDEEKNFYLPVEYERINEFLSKVNYNNISNNTFLQVIGACLDKDCTKKTLYNINKVMFFKEWDKIVKAFLESIDYIRTYHRITTSELIPYDSLIVPYAYYFYKEGVKPRGEKQRQLEDYFWRVIINKRYSRNIDAIIGQDIRGIIDKIISVEKLIILDPVNISVESIKENGAFTIGNPYIKGLLCILASKYPESFADGSLVNVNKLYLKASSSSNYHHFFPKSYLSKKGIKEFLINHIANITIIDKELNQKFIRDKAPSIYMIEFLQSNSNIELTMKTHLIDNINECGIFNNDYNKFVDSRLRALNEELKKRLILTENDRF